MLRNMASPDAHESPPSPAPALLSTFAQVAPEAVLTTRSILLCRCLQLRALSTKPPCKPKCAACYPSDLRRGPSLMGTFLNASTTSLTAFSTGMRSILAPPRNPSASVCS